MPWSSRFSAWASGLKVQDMWLQKNIWWFPKIGGPQYRPQNPIILVVRTPKKGTPNFGKPPYVEVSPT